MTINAPYKAELIHRRAPWKARETIELDTLEWVSWFNHRVLEPLRYILFAQGPHMAGDQFVDVHESIILDFIID